ncbi:MAG: hypothetical protein IID36_10145 [Planctomycetes bacterium]|nr:hypothetical protein [Planctomycetota bacterium]
MKTRTTGNHSSTTIDIATLVCAAIGVVIPTPWVSFPAAAILVLWLPGRQIVRLVSCSTGEASDPWMAISASMVLMPIPLAGVWWQSNSRPVVLAAVAATNLALILAARVARSEPVSLEDPISSRRTRTILYLMIAWTGACVFVTTWLPDIGARPAAAPVRDYIKHHAVMWSLGRYPLPLRSVFYSGEPDTPYYYYEYFYLVPAALRRLCADRVSIAFAFGATSAALAACLIATVFRLARSVLRSASGGLVAAALASVACGWDSIAAAYRVIMHGPLVILDSWAPVQWRIHNIFNALLWGPQHVIALLALILCCIWLRTAPVARHWILTAPLLAMAVFGSSVYQAIHFFAAAGLYVVFMFRDAYAGKISRNRDAGLTRRLMLAVGLITLVGFVLMAGRAWHYHQMSERYDGGLTTQWDRNPNAFFGRMLPPGPLANLLDLPWMLLIDVGLAGVACLLVSRAMWRRIWDDAAMRLLTIISVLGTLAALTIRSNVNRIDYGFRLSVMPAMVLGAICAGEVFAGSDVRPWVRRHGRWIVILGIGIGLPVGLYEGPATALRTLLETKLELDDPGAIRFIRHGTDADAVVQGDPTSRLSSVSGMDRRVGVVSPESAHVVVFRPLDVQRQMQALADVETAFRTESSATAYDRLRGLGVSHVLAGTPERKRYGELRQFEDASLFEIVYKDGTATVYRLIVPGSTGDTASSNESG